MPTSRQWISDMFPPARQPSPLQYEVPPPAVLQITQEALFIVIEETTTHAATQVVAQYMENED